MQDHRTLQNLSLSTYQPGDHHPILNTKPGNPRDVSRLHTKLKLATGTYILQTNRKAFNQNKVSSICLLCGKEDETKEHFLLIFSCEKLSHARKDSLDSIMNVSKHLLKPGSYTNQLITQLIIDSNQILGHQDTTDSIKQLDFHSRR